MPITILQLAEHRLGRPAVNGQDFEDAGLALLGGCEVCAAGLAAYNACPSKSGSWRCASGCIGDTGWESVEEANAAIFPPWLVPYDDIVGSFKLAMESAGVSTDQIAEILATVEDFAVNNLGDD